MNNLRLIAIEGGDQSGKETQARMLVRALNGMGCKALYRDFPDYNTPIGRLIEDKLHGLEHIDELAMAYLFEANKAELQSEFRALDEEGYTHLVLDRYLLSGRVYRQAHGLDPTWIEQLQTPLIKPDLTLILDVDPVRSRSRKSQHTLDLYERDVDLLVRVRKAYLDAVDGTSIMKIDAENTPQEVHGDIMRLILGLSLHISVEKPQT